MILFSYYLRVDLFLSCYIAMWDEYLFGRRSALRAIPCLYGKGLIQEPSSPQTERGEGVVTLIDGVGMGMSRV